MVFLPHLALVKLCLGICTLDIVLSHKGSGHGIVFDGRRRPSGDFSSISLPKHILEIGDRYMMLPLVLALLALSSYYSSKYRILIQ